MPSIDPAVLLQIIHDLQLRVNEAEARAERAERQLTARAPVEQPEHP